MLEQESPDVFTYAEVSTGSLRNKKFNQHEYLLKSSPKLVSANSAVSKYGESVLTTSPFHTGNSNGVISYVPSSIQEFFLQGSTKKLVFEIKTDIVTIYTVHLPLVSMHRQNQMLELSEKVNQCIGDVIVCGDFNIFDGVDELGILQEKTGLKIAGEGEYTFPTSKPKRMLDVFMYRFMDSALKPNIRVLQNDGSDHLPVMCEW